MVAISDVTMRHGKLVREKEGIHGGGLYSKGEVALTRCTISDNRVLERAKTNIGGTGGGIFNEGKMVVVECLVTRNRTGEGNDFDAGSGGGIFNAGELILSSSVLSQNSTEGDGSNAPGSGFSNGGRIGNSFAGDAFAIIRNCLLTQNNELGVGEENPVESINNDGGSTLIIEDSIISQDSGGIVNRGTLDVKNTRIEYNTTRGLRNLNEATLVDCVLGHNLGAAVINTRSLSMRGCTLNNNVAAVVEGGGVRNLKPGSIIMVNCTVSGNKIMEEPSEIRTGNAGGIWSDGGSITLSHCTVTRNRSEFGNGGGIYAAGGATIRMDHTLVSENSDFTGQAPDCFGVIESEGYNLISDTTGCVLEGEQSNSILDVDALLEPLRNNGGSTETHALLPDSPAINAGDPNFSAPPETDQRGVTRVLGGRIDIGAYEFNPRREFVAYNDFSWGEGQLSENITLYTSEGGVGVPPEGDEGALVDYETGLFVPAVLEVEGGAWDGDKHIKLGALSDPGTPAHDLFEGKVDATGVLSYGVDPITLTISGLDPNLYYDLTLFGNRDNPSYAPFATIVTITDAVYYVNETSVEIGLEDTSVSTVVLPIGFNTETGLVARYSKIRSGLDGDISVVIVGGLAFPHPRYYLNAFRLSSNSSPVRFRKIVDTSNPVPGYGLVPSSLSLPVQDAGNIAFVVDGSSIFGLFNGEFVKIVDPETVLPGERPKVRVIERQIAIDNEDVAFVHTTSGRPRAVYRYSGGGIRLVADRTVRIPGFSLNFTRVSNLPCLSSGNLFFRGRRGALNNLSGIYKHSEEGLTRVYDTRMRVPGSQRTALSHGLRPSLHDADRDNVVFSLGDTRGTNSFNGLYKIVDDSMFVVAKRSDLVPRKNITFDNLGAARISDRDILFTGSYTTHDRESIVLLERDDQLEVVAETGTRVPELFTHFLDVTSVAIDHGRMVITGRDSRSGFRGVYLKTGDSFTRIFDRHQLLEGKKMGSIEIRKNSLRENTLVFLASSSDGTRGIFQAIVGLDREERFIAYNDFSWYEGQAAKNITRFTTLEGLGRPIDGDKGSLIDFDSGHLTPVTLSVGGGRWMGQRHAEFGASAEAGTDAHVIFNEAVDTQGVLSYSVMDVTLTIRGLNQQMSYDLVLYGDRGNPGYLDRITEYTLEGADSFHNDSSLGAVIDGSNDEHTRIVNGYNSLNGYVAVYSNVDPGEDGEIVVRVRGVGTPEPPGFYLSALKLSAVRRD